MFDHWLNKISKSLDKLSNDDILYFGREALGAGQVGHPENLALRSANAGQRGTLASDIRKPQELEHA